MSGWLMTWLRQAWTGEEASDITDKGDVLRLAASGYTELTSLYVHLITIAAPGVKGTERAAPEQKEKPFQCDYAGLWSEKSGVAYPQGFAETHLSLNTSSVSRGRC